MGTATNTARHLLLQAQEVCTGMASDAPPWEDVGYAAARAGPIRREARWREAAAQQGIACREVHYSEARVDAVREHASVAAVSVRQHSDARGIHDRGADGEVRRQRREVEHRLADAR
jgi:surface antigen